MRAKRARTVVAALVLAALVILLPETGSAAVSSTFPGTVSLVAGANVNVSRLPGNQQEAAIAVNPALGGAGQLFAFSNMELAAGMFAAFSTDAGATWSYTDASDGVIADGDPGDPLPSSCCDPTLAWDEFGNLFIAYLENAPNLRVIVALSTDGGRTFVPLATLGAPTTDQPTITTGPGSVWVTYSTSGAGTPIVARGAAVTGLGTVGSFGVEQTVPGSAAGNFGDIAVGPAGQALVAYETPSSGQGPATLFVSLDADGLGAGGFAPAVSATTTNVGGFDFITPQPDRSVDAEAGLGYDRSGGARSGRVYLVYNDESPDESNDTDVFVRFSDSNGSSWSSPVRVNDDATTRSQFLPRMVVDPSTGFVGVSWHDARNDPGNHNAELFASISTDGGASFLPNLKVSAGVSNEDGSQPPGACCADLDYGDYTGLAFLDGVLYPVWADNSNSTGNNPDGATRMEVYTARTILTGRAVAATGGAGDDAYHVRLDSAGAFFQVFENSPTLSGTPTLSVPAASLSSFAVGGSGGNDRLVVDLSNGNPIPAGGFSFDGGAGSDSLTIQGGTFATVTYRATGPGSGTVQLDGSTISYTGLEPIIDSSAAASRIFTSGISGAQTIRMADDGVAGNGLSVIDSGGTGGFESVAFARPSSALTVNAGDGDDTLTLAGLDSTFAAVVTVNGEDGREAFTVQGTAGQTTISGGAGDDAFTILGVGAAGLTVTGQEGSDGYTVNLGLLTGPLALADGGSAGSDTLVVNGTAGDDSIALSGVGIVRGAETVSYSALESLLLDAGDGNDRVTGSPADDRIEGGAGNDALVGLGGQDELAGESGDDSVSGGAGADRLDGAAGADSLTGGAGADRLLGGAGRDRVSGGAAADRLEGGPGDDRLNGGKGTDRLEGGPGDDRLNGGNGVDRLLGGAGKDTLITRDRGRDVVSGGRGRDTARVDRLRDRLTGVEFVS